MTKEELLELREKLLKSTKYRIVSILGKEDGCINLELITEDEYLEENILGVDTKNKEDLAMKYFEKSCENYMRLLSNNNISYDRVSIEIGLLFYINSNTIKNKATEEGDIYEEDFNIKDFLNDIITINFSFSAYNNNIRVDNESVNHYADKLLLPQFTVDYKDFTNKLNERGFSVEKLTFEEFIKLIIEGNKLNINIDFSKQNKLK